MRRKKLSKIAAVSLAFTLCVGSLAGCGKKDEKSGGDDLYSVMQSAQDLETAGKFEMTIGMEVEEDDEKMELVMSGVTTDESFDMEIALNMDIEGTTAEGTITHLIYEDEHLYINMADVMDYMNSIQQMGELSDLGIEDEYLDIYVGDLYQQKDGSAAEEMADLFLEILEDAAVSTDKKEGAATDGNIEFKDEDVVAFMGNLAEGLKDNAEDFVDFTVESTNVSYDYEPIFDYYGDLFEEYGMDVDTLKEQLESTEEIELSDEEKETMVEEIETACDELITACEDVEDGEVKGSKCFIEASLEGKKGSRTYEFNLDFVAASEEEGEEAHIYFNYVFEEGEGKVEAPEDSVDVKEILAILEPFLGSGMDAGDPDEIDPGFGDDPTSGDTALIINEDGSYGLGCYWGDCGETGRVDFTVPEGYVADESYSEIDMLRLDDPDGNYLCVMIGEGTDYIDSLDYTHAAEQGNVTTGTISTPIGDMEYIINNQEDYCSIYGFAVVDSEHYIEIDYTVYEVNESTEEKLINELTNIAQNLKAVQ